MLGHFIWAMLEKGNLTYVAQVQVGGAGPLQLDHA